jgi:hypothetical protein
MPRSLRYVLRKFYRWYESKLTHAIGFLFVTHILQIPHFLWAGDCFLDGEIICQQYGIIVDFILYGIDLIEIPALINVTIIFIIQLKKKYNF